MRYYSVAGDNAAATGAGASCLSMGGAVSVRAELYDLIFSNTIDILDLMVRWRVQRITTLGTNSAVTPLLQDMLDTASVIVCGRDHSAEPTYTGGDAIGVSHLEFSINTRNTYNWKARPGCEFRMPATANAGFGFRGNASATTPNILATAHFRE